MISEKTRVPENGTTYDFKNNRRIVMILGSFVLVDKPIYLRILNIALVGFVLVILIGTLIFSIITTIITKEKRAIMGQALFTVGTLVCALVYILENFAQSRNLNRAVGYIREGIYNYEDGIQLDYVNIRKTRISHAKQMIFILTLLYFSSVVVYVILFPLFKLVILTHDYQAESNDVINDFLPLLIYLPFNTRTPIGFTVAFFTNSFTLFFMYSTFSAYIQVFIGCAFQLIAEYEVLNHSILNIEKRARYFFKGKTNPTNLFDNIEFQDKLFHCLNQNIIHHQNILRFKRAISPFLEVCAASAVLTVSGLMAAAILIVLEDPMRYIILVLSLMATVLSYFPGCYIGELVTSTSGKTPTFLYSISWPDYDERLKKHLKIFLMNAMRACILEVKGVRATVSLQTFSEVMSGGYKLFSVMR
uniref:Odorant receptor n=1 Tax=Yemma signatus TaxID=300820 RepID=A0A385H669_9HEMI|nr:odorant receptor [Yemma signatus]